MDSILTVGSAFVKKFVITTIEIGFASLVFIRYGAIFHGSGHFTCCNKPVFKSYVCLFNFWDVFSTRFLIPRNMLTDNRDLKTSRDRATFHSTFRGIGAVGSALPSHGRGHRFDTCIAHHQVSFHPSQPRSPRIARGSDNVARPGQNPGSRLHFILCENEASSRDAHGRQQARLV